MTRFKRLKGLVESVWFPFLYVSLNLAAWCFFPRENPIKHSHVVFPSLHDAFHVPEVNLDGSSGRLNIAKTLPGHREEVVSANVYWGDHAYPYVKAATISLQQDVLFWEVPWYKLKQEQISKEVSKERPKTRLEEVQDLQDIFWQPRCLPKGYQYRTRMVAYRSQAQYRERCALTGSLGGTIYSWEMHENNHDIMFEAGRFEGHTDQISTLSVDWKNGCALSGSCDATLRLWNSQHPTLRTSAAWSLQFYSNSSC